MLAPYTASQTPTASTAAIVILAVPVGAGRYDACVEDGPFLAHATSAPFLTGCRRLIELGYAPDQVAVMRHAGSTIDSLRAKIGVGAGLMVADGPDGRPRFRRWKAPPSWEGSPPIAPDASAEGSYEPAAGHASAEPMS